MARLRLALAQVNPTVGDLAGNALLVREWTARAAAAQAQIVVFTEMVLTGYPVEDLVFRESFVASGNETGPIALGGIRFGGDSVSVGAEARYQSAEAGLGSEFAGFGGVSEPRISLGGWTYQATFGIRFGR